MIFLKLLLENNIPIGWGTLWTAWKGTDTYTHLVSNSEVIDFARDQLSLEVKDSEQILRLAALYESDTEQIGTLLRRLANSSIYDEDFEARKWRLAILIDLLDHLPDDCFYAVLSLAEFWSSWGFPAESPIADININDYYDRKSFEWLRTEHESWVSQEKEALSTKLPRRM